MNAAEWLAAAPPAPADITVVGAPLARASISPSQAWTTPAALRRALARFSTWDGDHGVDLTSLGVRDLGDVEGDEHDPDCTAAHQRLRAAVAAAAAPDGCVVVIGGDNSITLTALRALSGDRLDDGWGLLTLDAHHDVRPRGADGRPLNGSPVRDLIELGLPGARVAQLGLHGFANSREHAEWAARQQIQTRRATALRRLGVVESVDSALGALRGAGARRLFVDIDMDVLDRAFAPACPASMPGGLTPAELQTAAFCLGRDPTVAGMDLCEVDAAADDAAGTTVRAMASVLLSFCAGVASRPHPR